MPQFTDSIKNLRFTFDDLCYVANTPPTNKNTAMALVIIHSIRRTCDYSNAYNLEGNELVWRITSHIIRMECEAGPRLENGMFLSLPSLENQPESQAA